MRTRYRGLGDPDRDYSEVPPGLQRIRRPYPVAAGMEAYMKHLKRHPS